MHFILNTKYSIYIHTYVFVCVCRDIETKQRSEHKKLFVYISALRNDTRRFCSFCFLLIVALLIQIETHTHTHTRALKGNVHSICTGTVTHTRAATCRIFVSEFCGFFFVFLGLRFINCFAYFYFAFYTDTAAHIYIIYTYVHI